MRLLDESREPERVGPGPRARLGVALGLLFLAGPVGDLADEGLGTAHLLAVLLGLALFIALYLSLLPPSEWLDRHGRRATLGALALLPVIAVALLVGGAPSSFAALFVYFAAAAGFRLPPRAAAAVIGGTAVGVGVAGAVGGEEPGGVFATVLTIVALGSMMAAFGRVARANRALRATREELARVAVSEERLRIARDMHDLLGHSLSVIALKSELAGKLVARDPARAAVELEEIQAVTREALAEVRGAVHGYRRLELADALEGAQAALLAAGIACELSEPERPLPAEVDAVLAWAVREGTTNVIRHSAAHHCAIRVTAEPDRAALEIEDDGRATPSTTKRGSGLDGLRERARRVRGELEAGARAEGGGFRLRLTVPLAGR